MASIIRIKRSSTAGDPTTLGAGELAYSALSGTQANGGDRLYLGFGSETSGNAANHFVIGGKYLGANPYLSAAMTGAADVAKQQYMDAIQQTRSGASQAGRYGSAAMFDQQSRASQNLANALAQEAGRLMYQNYGAERTAQQAAVQQAPAMAQADYADIQQLLATGQTQEDYARQKLESDIQRFEFGQNLPYSKLQSYLSAAYGAPAPIQQTTTSSGGGK